MQNITNKKILISPLDWGLGHSTRCISIIRLLLDNAYSVSVACNPIQKSLLQQEFNNIEFIELKGYNISYSKNEKLFPLKLIAQLPKIAMRIISEHRWLQKTIDRYKIDIVISDNRYGLFTKKVPCVFITHQLTIKAPFAWLENLLQRINYSYINRFTQCWVPDYAGSNNIAGLLSHPGKLPSVPVHYIGPLARFVKNETVKPRYRFCVLLSGPEPQRTLLENIILKQLHDVPEGCLLVRGKLDAAPIQPSSPKVTTSNHLSGLSLQEAILSSEIIITRSGYTSVMELLALQKKSILIPTPGQTEQEYLGKQLMRQQWALCINQNEFDLKDALMAAAQFDYQLPSSPKSNLEMFLKEALATL